jgi:hypothetical protein
MLQVARYLLDSVDGFLELRRYRGSAPHGERYLLDSVDGFLRCIVPPA